MREYHVGEMNDDQLYYFLVDKNTRNVLQIEYPSDIDEFNKILGTSEGKGNLLKDLGIILASESKVFKNPDLLTEAKVSNKKVDAPTESVAIAKKKTVKSTAAKKDKKENTEQVQVSLFAGLFD